MKMIKREFQVKSRSDLLPEKQNYDPSKDYVYLNSVMFKEIYDGLGIHWNKNLHPRKRPVVKITKAGTGVSFYRRMMSGSTLGLNKDEILLDWEALSYLQTESGDEKLELEFRRSCPFLFYFNHFDAHVRWSFKISFVSLALGIVSLVLAVLAACHVI